MPNELKLIIEGHLGKDPVVRQSEGGKSFVTFSVAASFGKDEKQKTTWVDVADWTDSKWRQSDTFQKGDAVRVEGTPSARAYTDAKGEARATLQVNAFKCYKIAWIKKDLAKSENTDNDGAPF